MQKKPQRGFVLLLTLIIIGAILSATSMMYTLQIKQLKLNVVSKESVTAYYTAEAGAECALYWFLRGGIFEDVFGGAQAGHVTIPDPTDETTLADPTLRTSATCKGATLDLVTPGTPPGTGFWFGGNPGDPQPCAFVTVTTNLNALTIFRSRGYNTCNTSEFQVERGFQMQY